MSEVICKAWLCLDGLLSVGCFFFTFFGKNLFLLGLVDQPFETAQTYLKVVEDDG